MIFFGKVVRDERGSRRRDCQRGMSGNRSGPVALVDLAVERAEIVQVADGFGMGGHVGDVKMVK
jgi:hypothetical protein